MLNSDPESLRKKSMELLKSANEVYQQAIAVCVHNETENENVF